MSITPVQRVVAAARQLSDVHVAHVQTSVQHRSVAHCHIPCPIDIAEWPRRSRWRRWNRKRWWRRWKRRRWWQRSGDALASSFLAKAVSTRYISVPIAEEDTTAPLARPHPPRIVVKAAKAPPWASSAVCDRRLLLQRYVAATVMAMAILTETYMCYKHQSRHKQERHSWSTDSRPSPHRQQRGPGNCFVNALIGHRPSTKPLPLPTR